VPIFTVLMRYNLVNGGLCSEGWAHVWSSLLPWATAWMLYQGSVTLKLLTYSGLLLNGFIDFLMPGFVTLVSLGAAHRLVRCCRARSASTVAAVEDVDDRGREAVLAAEPQAAEPTPPPLHGSPIRPFPPLLQPFYFEIIAGMVVFLLVLLPIGFCLQVSDAS